jgi:hypothetical protein
MNIQYGIKGMVIEKGSDTCSDWQNWRRDHWKDIIAISYGKQE